MPVDVAGRLVRRLAEANLVGYRSEGRCQEDARAEGRSAAAYWDRAGLEGAAAERRVRDTPVALYTVGDVDGEQARAACRAAGPGRRARRRGRRLRPGPLRGLPASRGSAPLAARLRGQGRPWLLARPFGAEPWTGPVFGADEDGPCWSCLAHRLREHRRAELEVQRVLGLDGPVTRPSPSLAAVRMLGLHSAVLEASKWLAGVRCPEQRAVCTLDSLTLRSTHHPVHRRPQCPDCGDPGMVAERTRRPVVPVSRPKACGGGSTDRLSAERMLERHRDLVGPLTGIVTAIRPLPGMPEGLHAYDSGHNLALAGHSPSGVRRVLRSRSGARG
ncbi:hypothetical protein STENM223S_05221 [Streptomyces tendae]